MCQDDSSFLALQVRPKAVPLTSGSLKQSDLKIPTAEPQAYKPQTTRYCTIAPKNFATIYTGKVTSHNSSSALYTVSPILQ